MLCLVVWGVFLSKPTDAGVLLLFLYFWAFLTTSKQVFLAKSGLAFKKQIRSRFIAERESPISL